MPTRVLTDLIMALLHEVDGPHHCCCGHCDGRCHRRTIIALHPHHHRRFRHIIECWSGPRPLPQTGWRTGRWSPQTSMPLHGVAGAGHVPSMVGGRSPTELSRSTGLHHRAIREEGGEEEDDERRIMVVTGPIGALAIRQMAHISVGPRGWPQGPLAQRTETTPPTSPTPSVAAPGPPSALPSSEAGPSGSRPPSDLMSLCGNRLLRRFAHHAAPFDKGQGPGSWDSMAGPSR
jgi:hypothetical protein